MICSLHKRQQIKNCLVKGAYHSHSPFWNPREPMPSFFHPLCKAGWCPAERFCRPLALKTGAWHIVHWTRAPFYEMWGKPISCREPQDVCFYYIRSGIVRQVQPALKQRRKYILRCCVLRLIFPAVSGFQKGIPCCSQPSLRHHTEAPGPWSSRRR